MANELNFVYIPGELIEAEIYAEGFVQQGGGIAVIETVVGVSGFYVGTVPLVPAIADGEYSVLFRDTGSGNIVGRGTLFWTAGVEDFRALDDRLDNAHGGASWETADVQAGLDAQGYTAARAALLDFLDAAISSRAAPGAAMDLIGSAFLTIQASILSDTTPFAGADIPAILATVQALDELVTGGRDIDFVGNDTNGWQRVERDTVGAEVARYNLFDEGGARITLTVPQFISAGKMISAEVLL